jgi:Tfp pilus assembly protein PilO
MKKHRSSLLASLAVVLVLVLGYVLWLVPLSERKEALAAELRERTQLTYKYQEKLNQAQSIRDNLEKHETELKKMQKSLFKGNDPYQLAASLGDLLSSKGGGLKLDIKTYQVLASKEYGLYQEVHLRFNFMATVEGLHMFLKRIRESEAAILVQDINIQKIQRKTGPDLVINVVLAALMEKGEKT